MNLVMGMFENEIVNITKLCSVIYVQPDPSEKVRRYDPYVPKYQLIYKISGEVITRFNEKTVRIQPGMVYILPKCDQAEYAIERTVVGDCIDIFFETDLPITECMICLDFSSDREMEMLFQRIYKLWISRTEGYYYKALSGVYEILYKMILKGRKYTPNYQFEKIEGGVAYLRNHLYDRTIDYYVPAQISNMSYTYFKKLFIEKFGVPPIQYVNNMRLERSRELLMTNNYSVGEIAKLCGFDNSYYFSRKFREKYQVSPSEYKKQAR